MVVVVVVVVVVVAERERDTYNNFFFLPAKKEKINQFHLEEKEQQRNGLRGNPKSTSIYWK